MGGVKYFFLTSSFYDVGGKRYFIFLPQTHIFSAVQSFLHSAEWQCQVYADAVLGKERAAVLPCHTYIPTGFEDLVDGFFMCLTPFFTVQEQL